MHLYRLRRPLYGKAILYHNTTRESLLTTSRKVLRVAQLIGNLGAQFGGVFFPQRSLAMRKRLPGGVLPSAGLSSEPGVLFASSPSVPRVVPDPGEAVPLRWCWEQLIVVDAVTREKEPGRGKWLMWRLVASAAGVERREPGGRACLYCMPSKP